MSNAPPQWPQRNWLEPTAVTLQAPPVAAAGRAPTPTPPLPPKSKGPRRSLPSVPVPPEPPLAKPRNASPGAGVQPPPGLARPTSPHDNLPEEEGDPTHSSACALLWRALDAGLPAGQTVQPRPYMALKDSSHVTTHEQQLQAYRAYEELLPELPGPLADPEHLLRVANQLLYLPDTFPAAYLQIYDPLLPTCLRIARTLEFLDLPKVLGSEAPQISLDSLQESIIGYGFLTTMQYVSDLFFAGGDIPGVQTAKFPAMACYGDPDYWLEGLLLAFNAPQLTAKWGCEALSRFVCSLREKLRKKQNRDLTVAESISCKIHETQRLSCNITK